MPEYHNPDPLVRLIGKTNEASAVVDGVPITCLIDSGSCMLAMVKSFAKALNLEIKPLTHNFRHRSHGGRHLPILWLR